MTNVITSKINLSGKLFGYNKIKAAARSLMFLLFLGLTSSTLLAQIPAGSCDGNPVDWANLSANHPINGYKLDPANATQNSDDQFTQGSKDEDLLSAWRWSN